MRSTRLICQFLVASLFFGFQWTEAQREKTPQKHMQKDDRFMVVDGLPIIAIDAEAISRKTGLVVSGLTHKDFIISENGIRQVIATWEQGNAPLSLLILVDPVNLNGNSGVIEHQLQALKSSLAHLNAKDEASLIVIADRPIVLQDFTGDKDLISAAIDMVSQYKTAITRPSEKRLLATLAEAAKRTRIAHNLTARKATVLLSNMPEATAGRIVVPEKVVRAIVESSRVFCSTSSWPLTRGFFDTEEHSLDKVSITGLVRLTGGEVLRSGWKSFIERLRERHRIGYVPLAPSKGLTRELVRIKLELAPSPGRNRGDFRVIYPGAVVIPASN